MSTKMIWLRRRLALLAVLTALAGCPAGSPARSDGGAAEGSPPGDGSRRDAPTTAPGEGTPLPPPTATGEPLAYVWRMETENPDFWQVRQVTTLSWYGRIDALANHTEIRSGYTKDGLMIHAKVFDKVIVTQAQDDQLEQWDALRITIDLDGHDGAKRAIDQRSFRLDSQAAKHGTDRDVFYRGQAGAWEKTANLFQVVEKTYRGQSEIDNKGWTITVLVPWSAIGLAGPPVAPGANRWRVAFATFDRDSADGSAMGPAQSWPGPEVVGTDPGTWGTWDFLDQAMLWREQAGAQPGAPAASYAVPYAPAPHDPATIQSVTIRNGLDGAVVEDAAVGASERLCEGDWGYLYDCAAPNSCWGDNLGREHFHVQNQADVSDWPCFAKIYLKFPLARVPAGKVIVDAALNLHHKYPTSGGDQGQWSLIHAHLTSNALRGGGAPWTAHNLTWNNAPYALGNVAGVWGDRAGLDQTGWDNLPKWSWDVSRAVAAVAGESHVSFVLNSTDMAMHTGKSFVTSADFPDWGRPEQRPHLVVRYADPR